MWRRRLARLIREARRRERAGDTAWFARLAEYGEMIAATEIENHRQFDRTIRRGGTAIRAQKRASAAGNTPKKAAADEVVLSKFAAWRRKVASQLQGLSAAELVRRYHTVKRPAERERRRLNALLKSGAISK